MTNVKDINVLQAELNNGHEQVTKMVCDLSELFMQTKMSYEDLDLYTKATMYDFVAPLADIVKDLRSEFYKMREYFIDKLGAQIRNEPEGKLRIETATHKITISSYEKLFVTIKSGQLFYDWLVKEGVIKDGNMDQFATIIKSESKMATLVEERTLQGLPEPDGLNIEMHPRIRVNKRQK